MSGRARAWRSSIALVVGALVVLGTLVGSDDWFPFAPMRQYAYAVDPDGRISTHVVEGIGAGGERVRITFDAIDMRPAELEGLLRPLPTRQRRLAEILATFRANRPDAPATVGIRYVRTLTRLEDRRALEQEKIELARYDDGGGAAAAP